MSLYPKGAKTPDDYILVIEVQNTIGEIFKIPFIERGDFTPRQKVPIML